VSSVQVRTASGTGGTLKGTVSSSGGYVSGLTYNTAYYLYPTFSSGYEFSSWAKTSGSGTLSSTSASNPYFTMGAGNGTVTITGKSSEVLCDSSKWCVQYNGNGLAYPQTSINPARSINRVNYNLPISSTPITKYAHTPNVDDSGTASGTYPVGNVGFRKIVTIPGASSMTVTLSYSIENNWDYLYVFTGKYTGEITGAQNTPMSAGQDYTFTNGSSTTSGSNSTTFTITGDTVTFAFWSDTATAYYGYYATITGYGYNRTVSSGEYATPTGTNAIFHGWSTTQTTPGAGLPSQVEYTDESDVMNNIPGDEGDTETLYAVWQQGQPITFTKDSNVSSIAVLDSSGTTVGTITASGQSLILVQGDTYTIKPTHTTGYTTNTITKTSGAGTISGKQFTVGAGAATINVTSSVCPSMQNLTSSTIATLLPSTGSTATVCDARDNQSYTIAKLADGKYWMTEDLNLAGGTALSANDTNVTSAYISSFSTSNNLTKSGNTIILPASSTSGFDTNNYSYVYNSGNITTSQADCTSSQPCNSYYSWDAATLGSGRSISTDNTDAEQSICPKGWKLPSTYGSGSTAAATSDFRALMIGYGASGSIQSYDSSTNPTGATLYSRIGPGSTPNFLLAGYYHSGAVRGGGWTGVYWSATSLDSKDRARYLYFHSTRVASADTDDRDVGTLIRCVFSGR
ncbi:hypothetical protein IKF21_02070, partial [Candidatus Saccharibacteria bacterium]|nr:hypothetical protein [Candidatus Saccharibacteria bacterium]